MTCQLQHRYDPQFETLPNDQCIFNGRHKCVGCAYDNGYSLGLIKSQTMNIDYTTLPNSQAGTGRHKSVQAAFARGYLDGVIASYQ